MTGCRCVVGKNNGKKYQNNDVTEEYFNATNEETKVDSFTLKRYNYE